MKRYILTLLAVVLPYLCALAQTQKHSIEIDAASFTPVQTDAISGVAIDKISKDHSNRECARIKMRINRMTAAEIGELSVRPRGGNVEVMKCVVAGEGNGLIIELTAKNPTTFYITHPRYGDSNEVSLSLEGDKEYRINAELCLLQAIVVESNIEGADVYIDEQYKGQTNENFKLTVNDMMRGEHSLRVVSGTLYTEQTINVTGTDIHFKAIINQEGEKSHWVVFTIAPTNALLEIDNQNVMLSSGVGQTRLRNGSYTYSVSAKDYHSEQGEFIVKDSKFEKSITLKRAFGWLNIESTTELSGAEVYVDNERIGTVPIKNHQLKSGTHNVRIIKQMYKTYTGSFNIVDDTPLNYKPVLEPNFANVTITTATGASIYIDESYKGIGTWSGKLEAGSHVLEARKEGHRKTLREVVISPENSDQRYTLPDPEPIYGTLTVISTPPVAKVLVDGVEIGSTPISHEVIIGKHNVTVKKDGYNSQTLAVTVEEGKEETKQVNLTAKTTTSTTTKTTTSSSYTSTTPSYYGSNSSSAAKVAMTNTKQRKKVEGFNLGISLGGGINPGTLPGSDSSSYYDDDEVEVEGEFNVGLIWRMWRHSSLFNVHTGVQYMRTRGINFLTFPAVLNWNVIYDDFGGLYLGVGTEPSLMFDPVEREYYGRSYVGTAYPLVIQVGMGFRNFDMNLYLKYYSFDRFNWMDEFTTLGLRFTYFF